jgi:8-hydroxy-5-deazaflavin:NADPH oxidoreductase
MKIAVVGAGRIGGNCARQLAKGGHEVMLSFSRDPGKLDQLAGEIGDRASTGTPADAVTSADVVVLSVPWSAIDDALAQMGSLEGKIVIDTTNQFSGGWIDLGENAAAHNARRMPGARYTKSFNTLTSAFQAEAADRTGDDRVVQWICGDDADAKAVVARLIEDAGYVPADVGGTDGCEVMEAPRRPGAVYGEEYRAADVQGVVDAVRDGREIPPTPQYGSEDA